MWVDVRSVVIVGGPTFWMKAGRRIIKGVLMDAGAWWKQMFIRHHFEPGAYARYGYRRRTVKYVQRKIRRFGVDLPLVWSGDTRRMVRLLPTITGTAQKVTVAVPVPRHVNLLGDTRFEITYISQDEAVAIGNFASGRLVERLRRERGKQIIRGMERRGVA